MKNSFKPQASPAFLDLHIQAMSMWREGELRILKGSYHRRGSLHAGSMSRRAPLAIVDRRLASSPWCATSIMEPTRLGNARGRCGQLRAFYARGKAIRDASGVMLLLCLELVTKGNCFKFDPHGVHDGNYWSCFEYEGG